MITASNSMTTLDTLPNELILAILTDVPLPSLLNLNLVNWRFHNLTLGYVYTTFSGRGAASFLRTIALSTSPSTLSHCVRNVIWKLEMPKELRKRIPKPDSNAIAQAYRSLTLASPQIPDNLVTNFETLMDDQSRNLSEEDHWYLEFFLLFLPNVETLEVHHAWKWDDHTYWFTNIAANATRFNRLAKVKIDGPLRLENIIPLLDIRSLKDLELWQVAIMRQAEGETFPWDQPHRRILREASSGLERLALKESCIDTDILLPILAAIRALKSFTYTHQWVDLNYPDQTRVVDYANLSAALSKHGSTLQALRFHETDSMFLSDLVTLISGTQVLKNLDVKMVAHTNGQLSFSGCTESDVEEYVSQLVPATLQTLQMDFVYEVGIAALFHHYKLDKWVIGCFARVMKRRGLKHVCFVHDRANNSYGKESEMLRVGFQDAGITFVLKEGKYDWIY
jgi:hypothetical protein